MKNLFILAFCLVVPGVYGACPGGVCQVTSPPNYDKVLAAYTQAVAGDTIELAAGTGDWSGGPLVVDKAVWIKGAGPKDTILQGDTSTKTALSIFVIEGGTGTLASNWAYNQHPHISHLTMAYSRPAGDGFMKFSGHVMEFEVDHCDLVTNSGTLLKMTCIATAASFWGWGVFHHNHFGNVDSDSVITDQPAWLPITGAVADISPTPALAAMPTPSGGGAPLPVAGTINRARGDGSWGDGPHWAEGKAWRFEDNIFEINPFSLVAVSGGGCRREVRFNTFMTSFVGGHGAETTHAGGRHTEYYNNRYWRNDYYQGSGALNLRATAAVAFNNRATNMYQFARINAYRSTYNSTAYGAPSGANPFDKNKTGGFTDVYQNVYSLTGNAATIGGATPDASPGHGDIYWKGDYSGGTLDNHGHQQVVPLPNLTQNGAGPRPDLRWMGFMLRNATLEAKVIGPPPDRTYTHTGVIIVGSNANSVTIDANVQKDAGGYMQIANGDHMEIRLVDRFIRQSGSGKGELLGTYANLAPNEIVETVPSPSPQPRQSYNIVQNKRAFPNDTPDGMWFWENKMSNSRADNFVSSDKLRTDPLNVEPSQCVNVAENAQQFQLGRDVFIPGLNPSQGPTNSAGRPVGYPYDPTISRTLTPNDTRLRIGADDEAYATFSYYNGGQGIKCLDQNNVAQPCTIQPNTQYSANNYWGRAYPDYLISTSPGFSSTASASFSSDPADTEQESVTISTAHFTLPLTSFAIGNWSPVLNCSTVTFTPNLITGTATLSGTATGCDGGVHTATITATKTTPSQNATQVFYLTITGAPNPNSTPTITGMTAAAASGTLLIAPAKIDLTGTASDSDGTVQTMQFKEKLNGGTKTNVGGPISGGSAAYTATNVVAGTHAYTVVATDDDGATAESTPAVSLVVVTPTPTPSGGTPTPAKIILKP